LSDSVHDIVVYRRCSSDSGRHYFYSFVVCHALSVQRMNYNVNSKLQSNGGV
jgi:hypothetical protein